MCLRVRFTIIPPCTNEICILFLIQRIPLVKRYSRFIMTAADSAETDDFRVPFERRTVGRWPDNETVPQKPFPFENDRRSRRCIIIDLNAMLSQWRDDVSPTHRRTGIGKVPRRREVYTGFPVSRVANDFIRRVTLQRQKRFHGKYRDGYNTKRDNIDTIYRAHEKPDLPTRFHFGVTNITRSKKYN